MSLDPEYINKAEEISGVFETTAPKVTATSAESLQTTEVSDSKGTLVSIPVVIKGQEKLEYLMRISEKMPKFHFWPRGPEIIHRLIMRAALAENLNELKIYRTNESALQNFDFKQEQ